MKYEINYITIHCSDSDVPDHDDIKVIERWHRLRGFRKVGYNYFLTKSGSIQVGRDEGEILAHAKGHNKHHIAICLSGSKEFTGAQYFNLVQLIANIRERHNIKRIFYHNELNKHKTCPNVKFDFIETINEQIREKEIQGKAV